MAGSENTTTSPVSRRKMLALTVGTVASTTALSVAAQHPENDPLLQLWRELMELYGLYPALDERETAAVMQLPSWARWNGRDENGIARTNPEWTEDMLKKHGIPLEIGNRPSLDSIEKLNNKYWMDVTDRYVPKLSSVTSEEYIAACEFARVQPDAIAVCENNKRRKEAYYARCAQRNYEENRVGLERICEEKQILSDKIDELIVKILEEETTSLVGSILKLRLYAASMLEWGTRERDEADTFEWALLQSIETLEALLPENILAQMPPIPERNYDRPDAYRVA